MEDSPSQLVVRMSSDDEDATASVKLPTESAPRHIAMSMPSFSPAAPPPATHVHALFSAAEAYRALVSTGEGKSSASFFKLAVLGIAAGCYISFGFSFCAVVTGALGNGVYGALAFPMGLMLIVLCGGELYTSNCCYMLCSNLELRSGLWAHAKIVVLSYFWNLVGCLLVVGLQLGGEVWKGREDWVHAIAHKKVSQPFGGVLCRAILANWMVNLAVYQAFMARDLVSKAVAVWPPIAAFVAIGLEHCIANMWVVPMSIYLAPTAKYAPITWAEFISHNLIAATIGNWIGGAIMVAGMHACVYGENVPRVKNAAWDATIGRLVRNKAK